MKNPQNGDHQLDPAEEAFAEYLSLWGDGLAPDFEEYCRSHPELERRLKEMHADWLPLARVLSDVADPETVTRSLCRIYGDDIDPGIDLDSDDDGSPAVSGQLMGRLSESGSKSARYENRGEIARGGMGVVLRVWDRDLRRSLAMKVIKQMDGEGAGKGRARLNPRLLGRFLEEAQITAQIDHPNIVPVHDIGLDASGRVYFTMPLVRGRNFKQIIGLVHRQEEDWTLTRALGVILKVCEAVAFAHSRGVVHRDIKPSNIMVGRFGETYLMDWGLALVMGRPDTHRVHRAPGFDEHGASELIDTDRSQAKARLPDSPLVTHYGDVVGTPSYMAPEQAKGMVDEIDGRTDVFAIGAILYHLLTKTMPYVPKGGHASPLYVIGAKMHGPPKAVLEVEPSTPPALAAICEKAMARDQGDRYRGALEMARDIEAFLERRPVAAHDASLGHVVRLAYERNRALFSTVAAACLALLLGTALYFSGKKDSLARERAAIDARTRSYDLMSARTLPERRRELDPALPARIAGFEAWLGDADAFIEREADWRVDESVSDAERETVLASIAELRRAREEVAQRLALARRLRDPSWLGRDRLWSEATRAIAASPLYGGLRLAPEAGLVPLGPDPETGYWEFWNPLSGDEPRRDPRTGRVEPHSNDGIVLVLLPGGSFEMGSPEYERGRQEIEELHEVTLAPFYIGKFEVTQAQWVRVVGFQPSLYAAGACSGESTITDLHPVESVDWFECADVRANVGALELPSEAQWEYACRAGTLDPWFWGLVATDLVGAVNLRDRSLGSAAGNFEAWDDGHALHAPVGSYPSNDFGLHDMHGNVSEWCADWFDPDPIGSGPPRRRHFRGGSFYQLAIYCRSALRQFELPSGSNVARGLRVAKAASRAGD